MPRSLRRAGQDDYWVLAGEQSGGLELTTPALAGVDDVKVRMEISQGRLWGCG